MIVSKCLIGSLAAFESFFHSQSYICSTFLSYLLAPNPPVEGVGPGSMADPSLFLSQLKDSGIVARVEIETIEFDFVDLESAWRALAYVTAAGIDEETQDEAKSAILEQMWGDKDGYRVFRNETQFIVGMK